MKKITFQQVSVFIQCFLLAIIFTSVVACGDDDGDSCGGAGTAFFDGSATIHGDEAAVLVAEMFVDENSSTTVNRTSIDLAVFTSNCDTLYTIEVLTDVPVGEELQSNYDFNGNQVGSAFGNFRVQIFSDETISQSIISSGTIDIDKNGGSYTVDLDIDSDNQESVIMRVNTDF
jgi:hypothetical protein